MNSTELIIKDSVSNDIHRFVLRDGLYYPNGRTYFYRVLIPELPPGSPIEVYYMKLSKGNVILNKPSVKAVAGRFILEENLSMEPTENGLYLSLTAPRGKVLLSGSLEGYVLFKNHSATAALFNKTVWGLPLNATFAYNTHDPVAKHKLWLSIATSSGHGAIIYHNYGENMKLNVLTLEKGFQFTWLVLYDGYNVETCCGSGLKVSFPPGWEVTSCSSP
ncbi:hypothetical protein [Thermococcus sp. GR6]|uniref:hypothetical protein n=1 Tax=Thermococcus sp. GR6 TaxID=1638256 RepID=UPI00198219B3|nr:hypothetical protein [Thermococcus sp. GR6]